MDDDFRLQIDLESDGIVGAISDYLRGAGLEHDLNADFGEGVIFSHEGDTVYLYAGNRDQLDRARVVVERFMTENGGKATYELTRWHPEAEEWADPEAPLPSTEDERAAEHERRIAREGAQTAEHGGRAEFEVRVEFPSHGEARDFAEKLKAEGFEPVQRWRYMVVGAADEDAANQLADRIREEAPADSKVTAEGSLAAAWGERPVNPFFFLGGLAG